MGKNDVSLIFHVQACVVAGPITVLPVTADLMLLDEVIFFVRFCFMIVFLYALT